MGDLLAALTLVFTAEMGDKSQLVVLALSPGTDTRRLLAGLTLATAALSAIAVLAGAAVGAALPQRPLALGVGLLFIGLGLVTWIGSSSTEADQPAPEGGSGAAAQPGSARRVVVAFVAAELGDKTQLATASMAAAGSAWAVWAGATLGFMAAAVLAVLAGRWLHGRVPASLLGRVGALGFVAIGAWELISLTA